LFARKVDFLYFLTQNIGYLDVVELKLFPLIVTVVPTGPVVGEKLLIVGRAMAHMLIRAVIIIM